jgi:hypothetical protein
MLYFRSQNKKADRGEKILEGHLGTSEFVYSVVVSY